MYLSWVNRTQMKWYLLLLAILICGCMKSQMQSRAEGAAEHYIRSKLGNPAYFKSVSFSPLQKRRYSTSLDTSLVFVGIDSSAHKKAEMYVDSENNQRPDLAVRNAKDLYNIEHDKLTYYLLYYSFRIDSGSFKKVMRYRFELDTACQVLDARDITNGNQKAE